MTRFLHTALLSAALLAPIGFAPALLRASDQVSVRTYHDKDHNDDHEWNSREDKAYRIYAKENHRKVVTFEKLKDDDQQNYWKWRHQHSDDALKIKIK